MKVEISNYDDPRVGPHERFISVEIDNHDTWDLFTTLGEVILPALKKFKEKNIGGVNVANEDLPEQLHSETSWHVRWDYILDKMIWAFENVLDDEWEFDLYNEDRNLYEEKHKEIQKGLELFGKYYRDLWI